MTVVIRPSPSVFQATTPLLLVFGADRAGAEDGLGEAAISDLARFLALARSYRVEIGFFRSAAARPWAPRCRPTIRDLVFEADEAGILQCSALQYALDARGKPEIGLCGAVGEVSFEKAHREALALGMDFKAIGLSERLRHGSLEERTTQDQPGLVCVPDFEYLYSTAGWLGCLRGRSETDLKTANGQRS